ncbi:MAG: efflux RND transporter periplasmic adaptor subunit [Candidatus Hydrogenedentes bacterium]|nr:efflux RND transporter periplasmic adaptor subunit [Candidatus Hydrogenedentota bacterium]
MRRFFSTVLLLSAGAAGVAWAFWYNQDTSASVEEVRPKMAPSVAADYAVRGPIRKMVRIVATIEPSAEVVILPKVSGHLEQFLVDLGDPVEEGQVVATIDSKEFEQRLKQAEASLMLAKAQLSRSKILRDAAQREYQRAVSAEAGGLSTEQDRDTAKANLDTAEADVALADAGLSREAAMLEEARLNLENTSIRAHMAGYIDARQLDAGSLVSPSTPLCTIVQPNPAKIVVNIPENEIVLARPGVKTEISVPVADVVLEAEVTRAAPIVNQNTRTTNVEILVPNADGKLRPGMYADVGFVAAEEAGALLIPETAIIRLGGTLSVNKIESNIARNTPVEIGVIADGMAVVRSGLQERDLVISRGNFMVEDGGEVRYTLRDAVPAAP